MAWEPAGTSEFYYRTCIKMNHTVCQILSKALHYPKYSAITDEYVAEVIAQEAANKITKLEKLCMEAKRIFLSMNNGPRTLEVKDYDIWLREYEQ